MSLWSWTKGFVIQNFLVPSVISECAEYVTVVMDQRLCHSELPLPPVRSECAEHVTVVVDQTEGFVIQNFRYRQLALSVLSMSLRSSVVLSTLLYSELPLSSISSEYTEHVTVAVNQD